MSETGDWFEAWNLVLTRRTRSLPSPSLLERLHRRIFGFWPQSVVERRMEAMILDRVESQAWQRVNPPPWKRPA